MGEWFMHNSGQVTRNRISRHDRPVVVLDPEDAEEVERLAAAWDGIDLCDLPESPMTLRAIRMQAALRELAAPTPPKCSPLALRAKNAECDLAPGHAGWHRSNGLGVSWE
jgi:hypothetical protein